MHAGRVFRTSDLSSLEGFPEYLQVISQNFCPFLLPALTEKVLLFTEYYFSEEEILNFQELQEEIFLAALVHTELLRRKRRHLPPRKALLMSENLIFSFKTRAALNYRKLHSYPHWYLKMLYTHLGLMFGKFWPGEKERSRDDRLIPDSPLSFLAIRTAFKDKDVRFFEKSPELLTDYFLASDADLAFPVEGGNQENLTALLDQLENDLNDPKKIIEMVKLLKKMRIYQWVENWCKTRERELKISAS